MGEGESIVIKEHEPFILVCLRCGAEYDASFASEDAIKRELAQHICASTASGQA